jgi:Protein kinase domain
VTPSPENARVSETAPVDAGTTEQVGQGRYVVVGSLGAGSQGETLEAVDKREGRAVAIKRFTIRGAKSWKDVELAEREATVLAALNHPSLPRYIEHFEENGALYLVMEKVEGESLAARRRRRALLDPEQVLRFLRDAAESLRYLHSQAPPIVHRDIKPGNVILRPDGSHCLVDFGSVRDRLKPEGGSTVVGTFGFMAPEQFQGRAAPVSDVYAVGATALSLITGREPEDLPHKGLGIDVEGALRGQVDRRLIAALRSMLEPDPDRRAASVANALNAAGLGAAAQPTRLGTAEATKQARRARIEAEKASLGARVEAFTQDEVRRAKAAYSSRDDHHRDRDQRRRQRAEQRDAERHARRERKAEQREARRARHFGKHQWQRPGRPVPPGIVLGIFILVALQVASVATFALFQVLLPTLFTFIRIPGRRERMLEIGQAGQRGLRTAREHIRHQFLGGPAPAVDTTATEANDASAASSPSPAPRQRISLDAEAEEIEVEAPEVDDDAKQARR